MWKIFKNVVQILVIFSGGMDKVTDCKNLFVADNKIKIDFENGKYFVAGILNV